jgi:hypothetical protein
MKATDVNNVFAKISSPEFQSILLKHDQTAKDIAATLLKAEKESRKYVGKIENYFKAPTIYETCQRIFYFLKNHVPYEREPVEKQTAKTINRIIDDAKKGYGNDCKHYATLAVCILHALGIKAKFRLVSFYENDYPTHAYAVAFDGKQQYVIDACLDYFDKETNYKRAFDINPLN